MQKGNKHYHRNTGENPELYKWWRRGKKNCYGRNCFPASMKIFKNLGEAWGNELLNTPVFLNLCMQHLGSKNVLPGLLMPIQRRIQQQICRCADSISKHQSLLNAQQHELCIGCWEECRWQPISPVRKCTPKAYSQGQGSQKPCFGNRRPVHT